MSRIALILTDRPALPWKKELLQRDNTLKIDCWPNLETESSYEMAIVWKHPPGTFRGFSNLKLIHSLGAGVDSIISDPDLPEGVQICRVVDAQLSASMSNYVIMMLLSHQRELKTLYDGRDKQQWLSRKYTERKMSMGIFGLGHLGKDVAQKLHMLGFEVHGYSRSAKNIPGVKSYSGNKGLRDMISSVNVLINLLPLTKDTENFFDASIFQFCQPESYFINVARGAHVVDKDLLEALDQGRLSGACLDVFRQEPLPKQHPFWADYRIMMTPHIASVTDPAEAAKMMVENYRRLQAGAHLLHKIDRVKGY